MSTRSKSTHKPTPSVSAMFTTIQCFNKDNVQEFWNFDFYEPALFKSQLQFFSLSLSMSDLIKTVVFVISTPQYSPDQFYINEMSTYDDYVIFDNSYRN